MSEAFFAVVNPAAGGGKCGKLVGPALERLRTAGLSIEVAETDGEGHATSLVREAYGRGVRRFISVGGDGTACEIVNGLFPEASAGARPTVAFLPLGTGNSFLRDFTREGIEHTTAAVIAGRTQPCDILRMRHRDGVLYFINLLSVGFAADVAVLRHRRFKGYGELGYLASVFLTLVRLNRRPFPLRVEGEKEFDRRRCLFLSFNNSKFTGGKMMIAPNAHTNDGLIEYVRWGPIGRLGLIWNLPGLYTGSHIEHRLAESRGVRRIEFALDGAADVMVDGEVMSIQCETLDVLPSAVDVMV